MFVSGVAVLAEAPIASRSIMAGGDDAAGEVEDSVMCAEDLNAIANQEMFGKTTLGLSLTG